MGGRAAEELIFGPDKITSGKNFYTALLLKLYVFYCYLFFKCENVSNLFRQIRMNNI